MNPLNCMNNSNEINLWSDRMVLITTDTLPHRIEKTNIRVREFRYDAKWKADDISTKWFVWVEHSTFAEMAPKFLGVAESVEDAFDRILFNSSLSDQKTIYLIQYWEDLNQRKMSESYALEEINA